MKITEGKYIQANELTLEQMQKIVQSEKERVHSHSIEDTKQIY